MIDIVEYFLVDTPEVTAISIMVFMVFWTSFCEFIQSFIRRSKRSA